MRKRERDEGGCVCFFSVAKPTGHGRNATSCFCPSCCLQGQSLLFLGAQVKLTFFSEVQFWAECKASATVFGQNLFLFVFFFSLQKKKIRCEATHASLPKYFLFPPPSLPPFFDISKCSLGHLPETEAGSEACVKTSGAWWGFFVYLTTGEHLFIWEREGWEKKVLMFEYIFFQIYASSLGGK